ncbi:MAG: Na(+)/H(+) antiporter subunit B [bacterium]|nr:Na(+)/H(+) antiporter subunit B [bacterium]
MRETSFNTGKFFALIIVAVLGIFMISPFFDTGSGKKISPRLENLKDRVSLHYGLKNVNDASKNIEECQGDYYTCREGVKCNNVIYKETADAETGPANLVTSIVLDYRAFDTLGEITVLFISILGVALLMTGFPALPVKNESMIQSAGAKFLVPIIMLVGIYIFLHGHLTPGGGFPGGAVIATGFLLMFMTSGDYNFRSRRFKTVETAAGTIIVALAIAGLIFKDSFFANFLPNGRLGDLFSSFLIVIIYSLIGIKVGSELSVGLRNLYTGEKDD